MSKILLIEDDEMSRLAIESTLKGQMDVTSCENLAQANEYIKTAQFDLVLLDIMLPDGDGFQFLAKLRNLKQFSSTPVLFISGRSSTDDQVLGYSLGADDYIVKPIDTKVLLAKIKAKLRQEEQSHEDRSIVTVGNLNIDTLRQKAIISDSNGDFDVNLTPIEMKIVTFFSNHEEHVVSREQLLDSVWGNSVHIVDRTIDTHVSHLRRKLSKWTHTIDAVRGMGYRLVKKTQLAAA